MSSIAPHSLRGESHPQHHHPAYSHSHQPSYGSSASMMAMPPQQQQQQPSLGPALPLASSQHPPPAQQQPPRQSLRPMSAYQPLDHPSTLSIASTATTSTPYRDSDTASFRSSNVQIRPPAPPIKFKSQDLRDALALHDAHTRKVYMEGYLSRKDELNPQGKPLHPADERARWSLCFLQLCGTVLSVWSVAEMTKAAAEGKEVPPSYIDITDAFVDYLGVLVEDVPMPPPQPARRIQHDNVFTLNSAGQNRIHFCVEGAVGRRLVQAWINALRLASWEKMRLEEIYTGALLRTRLSAIAAHQAASQGLPPPGPDGVIIGHDGTPLPPLKLITPLTKGKMEGWIKARFMGSTEWQKCYLVLQERRAPHEDESMMANAIAGSSSGAGAATIDASFGGLGASSGGGGDKKKFWQKLPGTGSNRDSILSFSGAGSGGSFSGLGSTGGPGSPTSPPSNSSAAFTNDPVAAGPGAMDPPPGANGAAGIASFYETKKSKRPFATMMHVSSVFAVYPSRPELVEGSSLFKVEGAFPGSNVLSGTHRARQTGFVLIMPEVDSASTSSSPPLGNSGALGANTKMMNWVIAFMDVFRLYGRPRTLSWDPRDPASFFFAYPIGPFRDRLFLDRELAEFLDVREERHAAQRANLGMVIRKRMQGERTPILPPLPVPNRESTALLERRASRLIAGGMSGTTAAAGSPTSAPAPSTAANGTHAAPGSTGAMGVPPKRQADSDDEDTEEDTDAEDDDRPLGTNGTSIPPLSPGRLAVTNGSPAPNDTSRSGAAASSSALTPADTASNIAQLRRLSAADPGLGQEFAALLNFDGGLSDVLASSEDTQAGGAPASRDASQSRNAILGPGAANAAASAYGGPTPSNSASNGAASWGGGGGAPAIPPKTPPSMLPSASSRTLTSTPASAPNSVVRPTAVLASPATVEAGANSASQPLAAVPENQPWDTNSKGKERVVSGAYDEGALFYMASMSDQLPAPGSAPPASAPKPAAAPAAADTNTAPSTPTATSTSTPASARPQGSYAPARTEKTTNDDVSIGDDALAAYSYLEKPPSPAMGSGPTGANLQVPTSGDAAGTDMSRGSSYSYTTSTEHSTPPSAVPVPSIAPPPPTSTSMGTPTTFSHANKRAMERKTAAQLQEAAHLEAMHRPGATAASVGAFGGGGGGGGKKQVDMGRARKRGTGAWGGDTSSDDDDEEEEEEEEDDEDEEDEEGGRGARNGASFGRAAGLHAQVQQQQQQHQHQAGAQHAHSRQSTFGGGGANSRTTSSSNVHNTPTTLSELQRAAANAGLEAPAPGRFSSYDGPLAAPVGGGGGGGGGGNGAHVRSPSPGGVAGVPPPSSAAPGGAQGNLYVHGANHQGGGHSYAAGTGSAAGWASGRSSPMRTASPAGAGVGAASGGSSRHSPRAGAVHVVGPGSPAMMLQSAMGMGMGMGMGAGGRATPPGGAYPGSRSASANANAARTSVFSSHLGASHDGAGSLHPEAHPASFAAGHQDLGSNTGPASSSNATTPTFVHLQPDEQPGAMTTVFQPQGLLQAGVQDKLERSAKAREEEARAAGGHLVSVPSKPPPPQAGLLGAITAHERDRRGAGGIGPTLTERERERMAAERRLREEEAMMMGMGGGGYRHSYLGGGPMMMPPAMMGMGMGMYGHPYLWQQMMMAQQQQQQQGGWGGSQMGGGGGAGSPGAAAAGAGHGGGGSGSPARAGTPSGAGAGFDPMAAQQAAVQAAQQAYVQAMSQMGGGGGADPNRMSVGAMGPMGMMGMGMAPFLPGPMSMMGFPPYGGGAGSMMGGAVSEYGGGAPGVGGATPSPASVAAAARLRGKADSPGPNAGAGAARR